MKKALVFMFLIAAIGFVVSCGSKVTEVAWENSTDSTGAVKEIKWADGDVTWDETVEKGDKSSAKEVTQTVGAVECLVYKSGDFEAAQVKINGQEGAVRLSEGSSQVLTLQAN